MVTLKDCEELSFRIKTISKMSNHFDPLYEYRRWWDQQGIKSEGDDGWPMSFCFEDENVKRFADYWNG